MPAGPAESHITLGQFLVKESRERAAERLKQFAPEPKRGDLVVLYIQVPRAHRADAEMPMLVWVESNSSGHGLITIEILYAIPAAVILDGDHIVEFGKHAIQLNPRPVTPDVGHRVGNEWIINRITAEVFFAEGDVHLAGAQVQLAIAAPQIRKVLGIQVQFAHLRSQAVILAGRQVHFTLEIDFLPNGRFHKQPRFVHAEIRMWRKAVAVGIKKGNAALGA